jgi:hypothetical protein
MLSASNRTATAGVIGVCLILGGCADYMASRDTITLGLGNAVETNIGIHTIDPFPPTALDTDIGGDGRVVDKAQRTYGSK